MQPYEQTKFGFRFTLDRRRQNADGSFPLRLTVLLGSNRYIGTGVSVMDVFWSREAQQVNRKCPDCDEINARLSEIMAKAENIVLKLPQCATLDDAVRAIRRALPGTPKRRAEAGNPNYFAAVLERFAAMGKKESTCKLYLSTLRRMRAYTDEADTLRFEDIDLEWLYGFDAWMARTSKSPNARGIHMRNIRAVFNFAIDEGITKAYPFRRFKIKKAETRKRSLSVERLRELMNYPVEEHQRKYVDMFMLMFYLCGINAADLFALEGITDGRIEYYRAKTGKLYSIKVEPEAMEIIERYRGKERLISCAETYKNHLEFVRHMDRELQRIGPYERKGRGGRKEIEPVFPGLSTYWARHTWATLAAEADVPDSVISQALGHTPENRTTAIYIDRNRKKLTRNAIF